MAIIYTYPIKQKPVAADLVVITDSEDKNFTKQCSIQSIIELFDCDLCTFCTTSISKINTPSGTAVESITCGEEINFTSSDASVSISGDNLTKTIDFKASGSGACPTTYVIKPVQCDRETGDCIIVDKQEYWLYSSDCFFETYAPGYIKDFSVNGNPYSPTGPSSEAQFDCYYVEEVAFTASTSNCSECCDTPTDPVIRLVPCIGKNPTYETLQSNITNWDETYLDNPCVFLDIENAAIGDELYCYQATVGSVDSGVIIEITNATTQSEPCSCDCCLYPCSFTLNPCPGDMPADFDGVLGAPVSPAGWAIGTPCDYSDGDVVNVTAPSGEVSYCFTLTKVCALPEFTLGFSAVSDCDDEECGEVPPPPTYTYEKCGSDAEFVTVDTDPGLVIGTTYVFCCDVPGPDTHDCYTYRGSIGRAVEGDFGGCTQILGETYTGDDACDCCENRCNYLYEACPEGDRPAGMPETLVWKHDEGDGTNCTCTGPYVGPVFQIGKDTWCYTPVEWTCNNATPGVTFVTNTDCGDPEFCNSEPVETLRYKMCNDETEAWFYQDPLDPIPAPFSTPGLHYIGDLAGVDCVTQNCCITVESTTSTGDPLGWTTYLGVMECDDSSFSEVEDCDCCIYYDVAKYRACNEKECIVEGYPELKIDVCAWGKVIGQNWKPGTAPSVIKVNIGGDEECCYEYIEPACKKEDFISVAEKQYEDLSYDPAVTTCVECETRYFRYIYCNNPEDALITSSIANPGIEDLSLPFTGVVNDISDCELELDSCCITIIEETTEGLVTPIGCWDTAYVNDLETCDCCKYKDSIRYIKCEDPECTIEEFDSVVIDACEWFSITQASGVLTPEFVYVEIGGNTCCYSRDAWVCTKPDDEVSSVVDSGEASCEACIETLENFKITNCNDPLDVTITNTDLTANVGLAAWLGSNGVCYTVDTYHGIATVPLGITLDTKYDEGEVPCDCCEYRDIRQYDKCAGVGGDACDAMPNTIYIDTNTVPGGPAAPATNIIIAEDATPTNECCYVIVEEPPCVPASVGYSYKAVFETCEELPSECVEAEETPKMLITGEEGIQSGTFPIVDPAAGEEPPFISGNPEDSWFSVKISEEGVIPEGTTWQTLYDTDGFFVSEGALTAVGNSAGTAFIPAAGFDGIGPLVPGAIYQISIASDFTLDPTAVEGMAGKILFYTPPAEAVAKSGAEEKAKTIYEEALDAEAKAKKAGEAGEA